MKKLLFVAAALLFGFSDVMAQSDSGDFTLSPHLGINFTTYSSSDVSYDLLTSVAGGVGAEYYFSDRWSLRTGLLYDAMGAVDDLDNVDKLNYLTVPINANWHFGKNRNWYLNFGPSVSILLSANSELSNGQELDIKDFISSVDVGFIAGIGYKFNINEKVQLFIEYQGYNGFINVDDSSLLPFEIRNARSSGNVGAIFTL